MKTLPALLLGLGLLAATPTLAQTPLDPLDERSAQRLDRMEKALKEIRAIVFQGRETGKPVVVEPADTAAQVAAMSEKLNDLEQTLTRVNGQLETNTHALDQAQHENDSLREENGAIKDRVTRLEQKLATLTQAQAAPAAAPSPDANAAPASAGAAPVLAAEGPAPSAPPMAAQDPASAFTAARRAYAARDFATAESGFRDYIDHFGETPRAPEARYFLGKSLLERQAYADAAAADVAAIRLWPQTTWAPDAVLDLSRSLIGLGKPADACQTLGELQRRYPRAPASVRTHAAAARREAKCNG
jgi:tol-pal system protein YbgF